MGSSQAAMLLLALLFSNDYLIQGKVENPDGTPAVGAKVIASRFGPIPTNDEREVVTTDDNGEFTIQLSRRPHHTTSWHILALQGDNHSTFQQFIHVPAKDGINAEGQDLSKPLVMGLQPGKRLFGTVYHEVTRQPIALAKLYTRQGQYVRTDKHGRFEFRGVPSGIEQILAKSLGKATRLLNVDLSERPYAEVDIFLAPGATVRGCVVDQAGQPVPNATIERIGSGSQLLRYATVVTAENGRYEFNDFPCHRLMLPLSVAAPGYEERNDEMFATASVEHPMELTLSVLKVEQGGQQPQLVARLAGGGEVPMLGTIHGRVVDPFGQPVRNFAVEFLRPSNLEPDDWGGPPNGARTFSQDDGRFIVGRLEAKKRYRVTVTAPGFGRAIIDPIYADLAAKQKEIEFRLTEPFELVVKVFDQTNQLPIADVMVGLSKRYFNQGDFDWNYNLHDAQIEQTSVEGLAKFEKQPMNEGRLFLRKSGYVRHQQPWTDNGKSVEISLQPEARISVSLSLKTRRVISGLSLKIRTDHGDTCYVRSAVNSPSPVMAVDQLLPGSCDIEVYDGFANEPWNAVITRNIDLKPGDNSLEIELP